MLAHFAAVRVLGVGAWSIDGQEHRYLDLYDPNGREHPSIRLGVHKDVPSLAAGFGDELDLVCEISSQTKVVRGADRATSTTRVQIVSLSPAAGPRAVAGREKSAAAG